MPIPRKFQTIVENADATATIPDYVWLAFAVCVMEQKACGWTGWIIEAAFLKVPETERTDHQDRPIPAADNQRCPPCGMTLFRTGVERRFVLDATNPRKITSDYESVPIKYE